MLAAAVRSMGVSATLGEEGKALKDYDKEIAELEARRREIGRKLAPLRGWTNRRKLVKEASELDRKIGRQKRERRRETERLEKEQRERLSARVKPAEISRVRVLRAYRMVHVYGAADNRIRPHLDHMKRYLEEFKILTIRRSRGGEKESEAVSYALTFGDEGGLDRYLEFTGWQELPDEL